jgi:hypothetical protein
MFQKLIMNISKQKRTNNNTQFANAKLSVIFTLTFLCRIQLTAPVH